MTIIEALKTGRPFKRKDWTYYKRFNEPINIFSFDILADDWEIKHEPLVWETPVIKLPSMSNWCLEFDHHVDLKKFAGKKVRVTVEEIE